MAIDPGYLTALQQLESGGNPNPYLRSPTGATGKYQFLPSTFRQFNPTGDINNPADQDAAIQSFTAANQDQLRQGLGRDPTPAELYLAHQQGAGGALKLLQNPDSTPEQLGLGKAVKVNNGDPTAPASAFVQHWNDRYSKAAGTDPQIAQAVTTGQGPEGLANISGKASDIPSGGTADNSSGSDTGSQLLGVAAALAARDSPEQSAALTKLALGDKAGQAARAMQRHQQLVGADQENNTYTVFDPSTGTVKTISTPGPTGISRFSKGPGTSGPTQVLGADGQPLQGPALLEKLPAADKATVTAIIEGRADMPSANARNPDAQRIRSLVTQADPTFEKADFAARAKIQKDYSSGKIGDINSALNTASKHLGSLSEANIELGNGQFAGTNALKNWWSKSTGGVGPADFETASNLVAQEMVRAYRGAGGAEADVEALRKQFSVNNSPEQNQVVLGRMAEMVRAKLESEQNRINGVLGPVASQKFQMIQPGSLNTFDKVIQEGQAAKQKIQARDNKGPTPTPSGPEVGVVDSGFRFKGGNPSDPTSWEKVQ